jgi:hypothetical protein
MLTPSLMSLLLDDINFGNMNTPYPASVMPSLPMSQYKNDEHV